jgi:hypothetical protein
MAFVKGRGVVGAPHLMAREPAWGVNASRADSSARRH